MSQRTTASHSPHVYFHQGDGHSLYRKSGSVLGAEEFRHYNLLGQKYFEITDNFPGTWREHTLTFGLKADMLSFRNLFISDAFGAYTYGSIAAFLADQAPTAYTFRYSATANPQQEANWGARQYGFYVQDEWAVTPTLKLTGGIRFEIPTYPRQAELQLRH